jgi:hypothetical protein
MPRRHRSGRERAGPPAPRPLGAVMPGWAQIPGHRVQQVTNDRSYRCPGCDHLIRPRTTHVVVIPDDDAEARRHWHTACWRQAMHRLR